MKYYQNDCVNCALPCIFSSCPYYKVTHYRCDLCGEEDVTLYHYNSNEICKECLLKEFEIVDGTDEWC